MLRESEYLQISRPYGQIIYVINSKGSGCKECPFFDVAVEQGLERMHSFATPQQNPQYSTVLFI